MRDARPIRVLLGDRPGIGRMTLARLVAGTAGISLVGEVAHGAGVGLMLQETQADVLIVDDRLLSEMQWTSELQEIEARVIVVGVDDDPAFAARAARVGAEAWVAKERADSALPLLLTRYVSVSPTR